MTDSYTILLVDDDELDRMAARRAFKAAGLPIEIVEAGDCATALDWLARRAFDCAFLDYQLPDGDGLTVLDALQKQEISTPVVMLTGHGDERIAVELMKAGAVDYLAKSRLSPEALAHSLRSAIRIHHAEQNAKRIESRLRESEKRFREMADNAPVLLWMSDTQGNCTFFNHGWLKFTGRKLQEEQGRGWEEGIHPEDHPHCSRIFAEAIAAHRSFRMEYRLKRADGQYRWILDTGTPRFSDDSAAAKSAGELIGYIGSCIDITERKEAEQALLEKQASIQSLNVRLQRAMTETHHRVKNNLQIISAMLDIQMMDYPQAIPTAELKQLAIHIHILAIVHDLLTEQAKRDGQAKFMSSEAVLGSLLPMLQKIAGQRTLHFQIEDVPLTANQGTSLAIITSELVSNALKHTRTCVQVSLTIDSPYAVLEVSDDGPGFPAGFHPDKHAHTGLELVQSLTRHDLGGEAYYENQPNGGSRVMVKVPLPFNVSAGQSQKNHPEESEI